MNLSTPLTISDLLSLIQQSVTVKGMVDLPITGINEIHSVHKGDLSFVDHKKYYERMMQSQATFILINQEIPFPEDKVLLICEDPLMAYLDVVNNFVSFTPQNTAIHPTAKIGKGTIIQPNVFIGENVVIGEDCVIHSNVSIYANSVIGNRVTIHSMAVIGADACYFQKRPDGWMKLISCGRTVIDDDVEVACGVCIDRGVSGDTYIGKGTIFDNLVQIGHDTHIGKNCLLGAQSAVAGCTYVSDNCTIWAKSAVNKDIYLAPNTVVLAFSALDKSVEKEGCSFFGIPGQDPRSKWKEQIYIKQIPELLAEIKELKAKVAELESK